MPIPPFEEKRREEKEISIFLFSPLGKKLKRSPLRRSLFFDYAIGLRNDSTSYFIPLKILYHVLSNHFIPNTIPNRLASPAFISKQSLPLRETEIPVQGDRCSTILTTFPL